MPPHGHTIYNNTVLLFAKVEFLSQSETIPRFPGFLVYLDITRIMCDAVLTGLLHRYKCCAGQALRRCSLLLSYTAARSMETWLHDAGSP